MNPLIVQQILGVVVKDFILPWVAKRKDEPTKKPKGKKKIIEDVKAEYEFSPQRAAVIAVLGGLLTYGVSAGYISNDSADCLNEAGQEVIEKTIE